MRFSLIAIELKVDGKGYPKFENGPDRTRFDAMDQKNAIGIQWKLLIIPLMFLFYLNFINLHDDKCEYLNEVKIPPDHIRTVVIKETKHNI